MVAAAYKLYRTLQLGDPQGFFNLIRGSAIDLTLISMDDNSVRRMHESLYDYYISRAKIFAPYLSSYSPGRDMRFYTEFVPTLGGMDSRGRVADETPIDFKEYWRRKGSK